MYIISDARVACTIDIIPKYFDELKNKSAAMREYIQAIRINKHKPSLDTLTKIKIERKKKKQPSEANNKSPRPRVSTHTDTETTRSQSQRKNQLMFDGTPSQSAI